MANHQNCREWHSKTWNWRYKWQAWNWKRRSWKWRTRNSKTWNTCRPKTWKCETRPGAVNNMIMSGRNITNWLRSFVTV